MDSTKVLVPAIRPGRVLALTAVGLAWCLAAYSLWWSIGRMRPEWYGMDYRFYRDLAAHWLSTGVMYPGQLAGPYALRFMEHNLYPPNAMVLFVPFVWLPAVLWWAVPIGVLAYALWRWRPSLWGWAAVALLLAWPRANAAFLFGNTDMWIAAFVAAGFLWGWPAVMVTIKPTLLPLALTGVRHRSFWFGVAAMVAFVLATLPYWFEYAEAMRNVRSLNWDYSLGSLPLVLVPVASWLSRGGRRAGSE